MRIAGLMQDYADAIKVADKSNLATLKNSIAQRLWKKHIQWVKTFNERV